VMYVVTEFGTVNLKGKCVAERTDTYLSGYPFTRTCAPHPLGA
jgi:hypothetical protein